jgi:flagellar assembly protein FliH
MPVKILRAESVWVSPVQLIGGTDPNNAESEGLFDGYDSEAIIAETKLNIYKLLKDAEEQAKGLIEEARQEAGQIKARADTESQDIRKKAEQAGYQDAQRWLDDERKQLKTDRLLQEQQMDQKRAKMIEEMEPSIVQLAVQIARQIIHSELKISTKQVLPIARAVLSKVNKLDEITLKVSSSDYLTIRDYCKKRFNTGGNVVVEIDETLENGSCIAETPYGVVDGTIEGQIAEIERRFQEVS